MGGLVELLDELEEVADLAVAFVASHDDLLHVSQGVSAAGHWGGGGAAGRGLGATGRGLGGAAGRWRGAAWLGLFTAWLGLRAARLRFGAAGLGLFAARLGFGAAISFSLRFSLSKHESSLISRGGNLDESSSLNLGGAGSTGFGACRTGVGLVTAWFGFGATRLGFRATGLGFFTARLGASRACVFLLTASGCWWWRATFGISLCKGSLGSQLFL